METKYICTHVHCSHPGSTRFEMTFTSESIMDDNNVATAFCPFCKKEMIPASVSATECDPKTTVECTTTE